MAKIIIRETLKEKGITVKELATRLGVTSSAVSQLLVNPNPSLQQLERVADVIGVDMMELFAQDYSYISGFFETNEGVYSIKNREQFMNLIGKVDGIVHIPSFDKEDIYDSAVRGFCKLSISKEENGSRMMRYGVKEVFTLSYDAMAERFSLTLCVGDGDIIFKTFDVPAEYRKDDDFESLVQAILSEVKSVYANKNKEHNQ